MEQTKTKSSSSTNDKKESRYKRFAACINKEDKVSLDIIASKLLEANTNHNGDEVTFTDLALFAISKLTPKDIEDIKFQCVSEESLSEIAIKNYNKKNNTNLNQAQFILKILKVNKGDLTANSLQQ